MKLLMQFHFLNFIIRSTNFHNYESVVLVQENSPFLFLYSSDLFLVDVVRYISELSPKKINIRNGEQRTSLHLAASLGDIEMCQVLIQCGARINSFIQTSAVSYSLT